MSKAWAQGSTRTWRRLRAAVLARDGGRCRLGLPGCTVIADCVHHTIGRKVSGDDPAHLVSACTSCNLAVGEPKGDPEPKRATQW